MFELETQLHESVNGVVFGLAKQFFPPTAHKKSIVYSLACLQNVFILQNILKRTTPGSRDEDTATKAFNELKKVVIIIPNSQLD